jgi:hypothetical protein
MLQRFPEQEKFENVIREKLKASPVIHCDETGMKVEGKKTLASCGFQ